MVSTDDSLEFVSESHCSELEIVTIVVEETL